MSDKKQAPKAQVVSPEPAKMAVQATLGGMGATGGMMKPSKESQIVLRIADEEEARFLKQRIGPFRADRGRALWEQLERIVP